MFQGSYVAIVTPFSKDGRSVDLGALKELIEFQLANGTDGIVPAGCTGEAATLSHEEQIAIIRTTVETVRGRAKVVAGTGSNCTEEALHLTKAAKAAGADGALVIMPYYNKPTPEGQFRHYKRLAEEGGLPIMLYNVPSRTGMNMLPETVARLRKEVKGIATIKEAAGNVDQVSAIHQLSDIEILSGDDSLTLPMYSVGGCGVVSVVANIMPAEVKGLCAAAAAGDYAKAREYHYRLLPVVKAMFIETNPICVKVAMRLLGRLNGVLRPPLCEMAPANEEKLRVALRENGFKV